MDDYKKIIVHVIDGSGYIYIILSNPKQKTVYDFEGMYTSDGDDYNIDKLRICHGESREEYIKQHIPELCVYKKDTEIKKTTVSIDKNMKAKIMLWFTAVPFVQILP